MLRTFIITGYSGILCSSIFSLNKSKQIYETLLNTNKYKNIIIKPIDNKKKLFILNYNFISKDYRYETIENETNYYLVSEKKNNIFPKNLIEKFDKNNLLINKLDELSKFYEDIPRTLKMPNQAYDISLILRNVKQNELMIIDTNENCILGIDEDKTNLINNYKNTNYLCIGMGFLVGIFGIYSFGFLY